VSFVPLLLAALASSGGDEVLARVDGLAITESVVSRRAELRGLPGETARDVLGLLVAEALLSADARRLGLDSSPEVTAEVDRGLRAAAARAMVESYATRREPDEATLRAMFHATGDFVAYEFLSYASQEEAQAARLRLDRGASFAAEAPGAVAARQYPNPAEAPLTMRAQLAAPVGDALFAAAPGALVGPVEDDKGWMLARVLRKAVGSDAEFAARRPALVNTVHRRTIAAAREHLYQQLRAKTPVKLDEAFLSRLRGAEASPEQLQHVIATVGGVPVRYAEVHQSVRALGSQAGHMASPGVKVQLATTLVNERLLEAFAMERGFDKVPEVLAQRPDLERNALARALAARIQGAVKPPTSRDVERHYEKNGARYGRPLKEVRPRIEAELLAARRGSALEARIEELRAKATITVDEAALARTSS
jgi:hypothetical protein